ncbi:zinc finger protein 385D isoform X4 [Callorhinchus milii]|uniref:zinc finger protein 385D isoform X4 n=1 Tax=Callorhinchus milii TaxID=7868 RepID=UPI0004571458|nr:zinc finger protein 385D isoform X4 [Callorhinchus milii]|eukprot:gi/632955850/ref/XP_007893667.1/ PREDICTED: zinc finger protein 385D isoform X3 [Callorhinchus milii]
MKTIMYLGSACQSNALSALMRPAVPAMQPALDVKPFLPFPLDTAAAVSLFPNFNAMDPVQKAVINHTFGVPLPPRRKQVISCNICQLRFNSDHSQHHTRNLRTCKKLSEEKSQAGAHYKGTKHAKKLKALEAMKNKQKTVTPKDSVKTTFTSITTTTITASSEKAESTQGTATISKVTTVAASDSVTTETTPTTPGAEKSFTSSSCNTSLPKETEEEKAKRLLYCSLCKVAVNSASQLEAHNSGSKHKTMLEAQNGGGPIKAFPRPGVKGKVSTNKGITTGLQNKTFHCEICDVHVNSETQLKQHISSRRHKDRAAGKPPKPKYSPYNKLQRGTNALAVSACMINTAQALIPKLIMGKVKLAFQKEFAKPLTARILPNPLAAAAAAAAAVAANSQFTLRPSPAATFFQTAGLPPALLRPAPGPIRATHTPVLFAPY